MTFIPDPVKATRVTVPYFEDSASQKVPGRGTHKTVDRLQTEIRALMAQLDSTNVFFSPGQFPVTIDQPPRFGWQMTFLFRGLKGRMEIAALPLRKETPNSKDAALRQCLYLVRNWLESEVYSQLYRPGVVPLLPFLLAEGGKTIGESLAESRDFPKIESHN